MNASASGTCRVYDGHYLVGNYYQWNAATAGTGGTVANKDAVGSVCPKGWKLPSSATSNTTITKGTYAYLLQQYGLASAYNSGSVTGTSAANGNTYNIALSPLFFVRGGDVDSSGHKFGNAGRDSYCWSSRAYSSASLSYYLNFTTSVYPLFSAYRYDGFSLRCLISTP